jgi:hypothetical protein
VVGVLGDDTDPMVTVMKLEKAPQETYADIGGLDNQIQEIKVQHQPGAICRSQGEAGSPLFYYDYEEIRARLLAKPLLLQITLTSIYRPKQKLGIRLGTCQTVTN